jgi:hypothetical protein
MVIVGGIYFYKNNSETVNVPSTSTNISGAFTSKYPALVCYASLNGNNEADYTNYQLYFVKDGALTLDVDGEQSSPGTKTSGINTKLRIQGHHDEKNIYFDSYKNDSDKGELKKGDVLFVINKFIDSNTIGELNSNYELTVSFNKLQPPISIFKTVNFHCDETGNTE